MKKLLCLILALLLSGCAAAPEPAETAPVELTGSLKVEYLAGGTLLQCNGEAALVDCGENITAELLKSYGVENLSAIILTGCAEAQTAGLAGVLEAFPATVYAPGGVEGVQAVAAENKWSLWLDCARLTILRPGQENVLALQAEFGEDRFAFLGAMPEEAQRTLIRQQPDLKAEVLRFYDSVSPAEELLSAAEAVYIIVDGEAEEALKERFEVLSIDGNSAVTAETQGRGVSLIRMFAGSVPATY